MEYRFKKYSKAFLKISCKMRYAFVSFSIQVEPLSVFNFVILFLIFALFIYIIMTFVPVRAVGFARFNNFYSKIKVCCDVFGVVGNCRFFFGLYCFSFFYLGFSGFFIYLVHQLGVDVEFILYLNFGKIVAVSLLGFVILYFWRVCFGSMYDYGRIKVFAKFDFKYFRRFGILLWSFLIFFFSLVLFVIFLSDLLFFNDFSFFGEVSFFTDLIVKQDITSVKVISDFVFFSVEFTKNLVL